MYWILAAPSLAALLFVVCLLPYRIIRRALNAARAREGNWRGPAVRTETRAIARFIKRAVLVPLVILFIVQVGLVLHYEFLGPAHLLANVYGTYHPELALSAPDLEAWAHAYEAQQRERARSAATQSTLRSIRVALAEHWPLYPGYLFLSLAFLLYFYVVQYPRLVLRYRSSVRSRLVPSAHGLPAGTRWHSTPHPSPTKCP